MDIFYWLLSTAQSECGHLGTLPEEQYHNDDYKETIKYFQNLSHEIKIMDFNFDKTPCDIAMTPFANIISDQFKNIAERMGIRTTYSKINVYVGGEKIKLNYYFAEPELVDNLIDIESPRTKVRPENDKLGFSGWITHNTFKTRIHYKSILDKHWVIPSNTFGTPWIVSGQFKKEIEKNGLTNFNFIEAAAATDATKK